MSPREELIEAIKSVPDAAIGDLIEYTKVLKTKQSPATSEAKPVLSREEILDRMIRHDLPVLTEEAYDRATMYEDRF